MKRVLLLSMLLATAACSELPSEPTPVQAQKFDAVVREPTAESINNDMAVEDTRFCTSNDRIDAHMEEYGLRRSTYDEAPNVVVYISEYDDGAVRHVSVEGDESCFFEDEPTDHEHSSVTGELSK